MSKFKFVVVSKDNDIKISNAVSKAMFDINGHEVDVSEITNNKLSLATVYNMKLNEERQFISHDFLVFMHADVTFDVKQFLNHVEQCKCKYDVMGLCGTSTMNVSQSPLNWWTGSNPTPTSKWGCVTHGELGDKKSFFNSHSPDITDHEAACIDGLCIVFGPKAIESGMTFDEQFTYDFYDTDISFQTVLKYKLKLGVIVEQSLQHYSVGKSILTKEFLSHEIDFRKKWSLEIPPNSPIRQMLSQSS